jgi:hypothetical protein
MNIPDVIGFHVQHVCIRIRLCLESAAGDEIAA